MENIDYVKDNSYVRTDGLEKHGIPEIRVKTTNEHTSELEQDLLSRVADWAIATSDELIATNIQYGVWELKLKTVAKDLLEVYELNIEGKDFTRGADLAVKFWIEQHDICKQYDAHFVPPTHEQMVVVSQGVFEGLPVQAVRYPSPSHMSGWWLTTDKYDGDIKSLKTEHLHHLIARRQDLVKYLALPFGFRVDENHSVWYEQSVADQPIV